MDRNEEIIKLVNSGKYNLTEIGKKFEISHERVRQIYFRKYGRSHRPYIRAKKRKAYKTAVKFDCAMCGVVVRRNVYARGIKYCKKCSDAVRIKGKHPSELNECEYCHKMFVPDRHYFRKNIQVVKQRFCKPDCWYEYKKLGRGKRRPIE